jgi:ferredoxin-type protein NapH
MAAAGTPPSHRFLVHWRNERNSAALYAGLAALERIARRRRVYTQLAQLEERHAEVWAEKLRAEGIEVGTFQPSWRTRTLLVLARRLGPTVVLPRIARLERRDAEAYLAAGQTGDVVDEEHSNAALLAEFSARETAEFFKKAILKIRSGVILTVGAVLFAVSLLLARNVQLEGLFFGLLTGVAVGPVIHYLLGKVLIALPLGRIWCGWACWTAAVVDQLPYRKSPGWLPQRYRRLRYVHFFSSLTLVVVLTLGFGYGAGAVGPSAAWWFVIGNLLYWITAVGLAVTLRDNRAFCKYACPVPVILKVTSRPALVKVAGDAAACQACASKACTTLCPMDIDIPAYVERGTRVLSTECILCQHCIAICPPNTLALSFAFDLAGEDLVQERQANRAPR